MVEKDFVHQYSLNTVKLTINILRTGKSIYYELNEVLSTSNKASVHSVLIEM